MPSGLVNSASKGDVDIPGVPIVRDWFGIDAAVVGWCMLFPAFEIDEIPEFIFSESPGIGDGAMEVEGDGATNGEFTDCRGVPVLVCEDRILCWSICGEE